MTTAINWIWMPVVLNLALSSSHIFKSTTRVENKCKLNNVALQPDSLRFETEKLRYNEFHQNIENYIEWYYNNHAKCENGKYIRSSERTKRYSDNRNATKAIESSAYEPKRSKRFIEKIKIKFLEAVGTVKKSFGHVIGDLSGFKANLKLEKSLCSKFTELCPLFDTMNFKILSQLNPKLMANSKNYGRFDKNRNINFGDILACAISNTGGLIMHYMMGYNSSNLVVQGTGNTKSKHTSTKMSIILTNLNERKDDAVRRCYHLPLRDTSEENIEKIEMRLSNTLMSQKNNKIMEYSLDTCNCQTLALYWVYGPEIRSCGGCSADLECSDFKFIEATYDCADAKSKVLDCISDKYGQLSI